MMLPLYDQIIKNTARLESKIQLSYKQWEKERKEIRGVWGEIWRKEEKKKEGRAQGEGESEDQGDRKRLRIRLDLI